MCTFLGFSQFNPAAPWMRDLVSSRSGEFTIDEQVAAFNTYWSTRDKNVRGSGYKPFMRWEYHWRNYTNEQGYIMSATDFWNEWEKKKNASLSNNMKNMAQIASNWQPVGPFSHTNTGSWSSGQGRVNIVHVDPSNSNTIYLGAPAGGIWKSIDNGSNWVPLTDELPQIGVSGIAVDYSNSNTIYIATGDKDAGDSYSVGVFKSTNGGLSWNTTGTMGGSNPSRAGDILIHPTNNQMLWCATNDGIYRTINAGNSWTLVQSGNFAQGNLRLKPGDPSTVYAVSNNKFFKSTNSGASFTDISATLPASSSRLIMDVTPANANYIYILSANSSGDFQGIYRSSDSGATFEAKNTTTNVFQSPQAWYDLALAVSSTNAEEIYTGCLNVWKSTNGGVEIAAINSWSNPTGPSYTHADIHYLGFHGNKLFCGSDGGIYVSSNNGANFTDLTSGVQISQFYKIAVSKQSAGKLIGGLQDNGGHAYSGGQWKNYYGADGMDTAIDPTNQNLYYGFIQFGSNLYVSSNAGNSPTAVVASPAGVEGNWVTPLVSNSVGTLYSGFGNLFKLTDGVWLQQNTSSLGSGNLELVHIDPSNDAIIYVSNGNKLYKSTNSGVVFTQTYTASSTISSIEVHSTNSSIVYVTTENSFGGVFKSVDGGTTFTNFAQGLPNIGKNIIVHQARNANNPLFLGTNLGVYHRDDTMSAWEAYDINLPNVSVTDLEINLEDAKLIAATYGRGIWQTNIEVDPYPIDLKFISVQNPGTLINCQTTSIPKIEVKNNGNSTLNTMSINYDVNGNSNNYTWNGTLLAGNSTLIDLPQITTPRGAHQLLISTSTANDANLENNAGSSVFYTNDSGTVNTINTFTSTTTDKLLAFKDGTIDSQWVIGTRTGLMTGGLGNNVYTTNLTGNYPDNVKAYLVSQCYNLANVTNPQISFSMKYDLEQNWDIVYMQYSTNFGATWSVLGSMGTNWYNSDRTPLTSGTDCNNCPGAQWTGTDFTLKNYTYPLNAFNSETNIMFRFVFHTDQAANQQGVVVDNFVITGTLSNQDFEWKNVSIYPNPSKGIFTLNLGNKTPSAIEIYDVLGKKINTKTAVQIQNSETNIDLSNVQSGIYFVKIIADDQTIVKRIIKE